MHNDAETLLLTRLRTADGRAIRKTVTWRDGIIAEVSSYPKRLTWWLRSQHTLPADIDALAAFIAETAADSTACIAPGVPINLDRWPVDQRAPRRKLDHPGEPATMGEHPSPWLAVDVDSIDVGIPLDPLDPEPSFRAAAGMLGEGFANASLVWTLTSKATPGATTLRGRLWFITTKPISNPERKAWALSTNARLGIAIADRNIYEGAERCIYTAVPAFEGGHDPFPARIGVSYGEKESVDWSVVDKTPPTTEDSFPYTGRRQGGPIPKGINERLERIGDGLGQEGIDAPIYDAVVSMVRARWTVERIVEAVQEAIATTASIDPAKHSREYVARKITPREIRRNIKNATRFLATIERLPRTTQTRQILEPLPLGEAESKLRETVREFYGQEKAGYTVILGTVGLGKTHVAVDELPDDTRILWAHLTHEQGEEVQIKFNRKHEALANKIEGRRGSDTREGLCQRPHVLEAIHEAGLDAYTEAIACGGLGSGTCQFYNGCPYFRQFHREEQVRLIPHAYLGPAAQRSRVYRAEYTGGLHGAVIDENPLDQLIGRASYKREDVAAASPLLAESLALIEDGEDLSPAMLAALSSEMAMEVVEIPGGLAGPETEWALLQELKLMAQRPRVRFRALFRAVLAHQAGSRNLLWFGADGEGTKRVFCAWRNELHMSITRGLLLDATGSEDIYRALLGENTRFVHIHAEQRLEIIQASDLAVGKRQLGILNDSDHDGLLARAAALARMLNAGLISNRAAIELATARGWLDDTAPTGWFGNLRGLNRFENLHTLVIAGRPEPPALEVEAIARGLWPEADLNFTGRYVWRQDGLLSVAAHEDPRIDAVLRMIREAEVMQAIGRLRALRAVSIKRVILLTSTPIPLPVTLRPLAEILPSEKLARLFLAGDGVVPLAPELMVRMLPSEFPTVDAAKSWLKRERVSLPLLNTLYKAGDTLKFRTQGQRCPSTALAWVDHFDARQKLEQLTGQRIVDCRPADPDPATQATTAEPARPQAEATAAQARAKPAWERPRAVVRPFAFRDPSAAPPPTKWNWERPSFRVRQLGPGAMLPTLARLESSPPSLRRGHSRSHKRNQFVYPPLQPEVMP